MKVREYMKKKSVRVGVQGGYCFRKEAVFESVLFCWFEIQHPSCLSNNEFILHFPSTTTTSLSDLSLFSCHAFGCLRASLKQLQPQWRDWWNDYRSTQSQHSPVSQHFSVALFDQRILCMPLKSQLQVFLHCWLKGTVNSKEGHLISHLSLEVSGNTYGSGSCIPQIPRTLKVFTSSNFPG